MLRERATPDEQLRAASFGVSPSSGRSRRPRTDGASHALSMDRFCARMSSRHLYANKHAYTRM
eukprot:12886945-Prorocentrum_lima.AAC.1